MKRILIDTQVLLWWLTNDPQLGKRAKSLVADANNDIFVSAVTAWEISIKVATGKLIALVISMLRSNRRALLSSMSI